MKKIISAICMLMLAVMLTFSTVSCSSFSNNRDAAPTDTVELFYDYNQTLIEDFDWVASQYEAFRFLEADAVFDTIVSETEHPNVVSITTIFQVEDTCITIEHPEDMRDSLPIITKINDIWMECMAINARTPVTLDSVLKIADPYKEMLNTRMLTLRRLVGPPFPEHAEYIFGNGILFIDAVTGDVRLEEESED